MKNRLIYLTVILVLLSLVISDTSYGQRRRKKKVEKTMSIYDVDTLTNLIPLQRRMFHDKIDRVQKSADASDGRVDNTIFYAEDTVATNLLTSAILRDVDHMQIMIENLPFNGDGNNEDQMKKRYLGDLYEMVRKYNNDRRGDPVFTRRTVNNFRELLI